MPRFNKGITIALAPWKTVNITVIECDSFEECNKLLKEELDRMPEVKKLNEADLKKVFK